MCEVANYILSFEVIMNCAVLPIADLVLRKTLFAQPETNSVT